MVQPNESRSIVSLPTISMSPGAAVRAGGPSPGVPARISGSAIYDVSGKKTHFVDFYELWGLSKADDRMVMCSEDYAVWLDKDGTLDWQTTDRLDRAIEKRVDVAEMNAVFNQAATLQAYPVEYLTRVQRDTIRTMVGEGLTRLFELDAKSAMQMLDKASEYAVARNQEVARMWYLCATGCATAFFTVLLGLGWIFRVSAPNLIGNGVFYLSLGSCAGALGAFFSILTRVGTTPLDPSAGWKLHWLEGIGRIVVGVMAAAFAQIAVKLGLVLTMLADKGYTGLFLVSIVAGASERLVPAIIKRMEMDGDSKLENKNKRTARSRRQEPPK